MKHFMIAAALAFTGFAGLGEANASQSSQRRGVNPSPYGGVMHPTYGHIRAGVPFMGSGQRSYRSQRGHRSYNSGRHFNSGRSSKRGLRAPLFRSRISDHGCSSHCGN